MPRRGAAQTPWPAQAALQPLHAPHLRHKECEADIFGYGAAQDTRKPRQPAAEQTGSVGPGQTLQSRDTKSVSPPRKSTVSGKYVGKAERVREKNRLAQARFRQKQRVRLRYVNLLAVWAEESVDGSISIDCELCMRV